MSHVEQKSNEMIIDAIAKQSGDLVITRSRKRGFLVIYIAILGSNKLTIGMQNYIQEYVGLFDENMSTKLLSAANKNLHKVDPDSPILQKKQEEDFHSVVANILWTTKKLLSDIETVVAFICT